MQDSQTRYRNILERRLSFFELILLDEAGRRIRKDQDELSDEIADLGRQLLDATEIAEIEYLEDEIDLAKQELEAVKDYLDDLYLTSERVR